MKKLLTCLMLTCCSLAAASKIIDFDFKKVFASQYAYIDLNFDGHVDDDEILTADITVYTEYLDFGKFGNRLYIEFYATNGEKDLKLVARYKDVRIEKSGRYYQVRNQLGEMLFSTEDLKCYHNVVCIHDLAAYSLMNKKEGKEKPE